MSESVTLEALAKRLDALEVQLAAKSPPWLAFVNSIDQSEEAVAFRRRIDEEVQKARDAERADSAPDDPPQIVWKNWEHAVGVVTDLEGYAEIAAAGQAIRQVERDEARREPLGEDAA